jgi:hypothetical protein
VENDLPEPQVNVDVVRVLSPIHRVVAVNEQTEAEPELATALFPGVEFVKRRANTHCYMLARREAFFVFGKNKQA